MGSFIAIAGPVAHPEPLVTKVVTPDPVPVSIIV
ncbi:rCG40565, isoform CRA_b [Rattus norvegicus]|uniref:RCG40565, isoform CRA_b n=1 Tax=Rattus norvegicus TaxID=10116 RepID=A6I903_RAT|nr:rCG40565, isoform CRA_b [Rattus norvegicus]